MTDPKPTQAVLREAKLRRDDVIAAALTSYWSTALLLMALAAVFANIPWTASTPVAETRALAEPAQAIEGAEQEGNEATEADDHRLR